MRRNSIVPTPSRKSTVNQHSKSTVIDNNGRRQTVNDNNGRKQSRFDRIISNDRNDLLALRRIFYSHIDVAEGIVNFIVVVVVVVIVIIIIIIVIIIISIIIIIIIIITIIIIIIIIIRPMLGEALGSESS